MCGFKVDLASCQKQIRSIFNKCTDDEQPSNIEYLDHVKNFDSSSTTYVIPEHHPICIVFTSKSADNHDTNHEGTQIVAVVLRPDNITNDDTATHAESVQYPLHQQARIICGLFDNRTAARSLSGCKPNRLNWTEVSQQVEHSQQLITKKIDILKRIQDCYEPTGTSMTCLTCIDGVVKTSIYTIHSQQIYRQKLTPYAHPQRNISMSYSTQDSVMEYNNSNVFCPNIFSHT